MSHWKKDRADEPYRTETAKTENFFTRNVKLITFLVTVGVFLAVFGPIFVLEARQYYGQDKDTRPKMTMYDMILISEQKPITANQLTKYACTESEADGQNVKVIRIEIDDGRYMAIATADMITGIVVECLIQDMEGDSDDRWNAMEDDLREIFGK